MIFYGLQLELGVKQTTHLCRDEGPVIKFRNRFMHLKSFGEKVCHLGMKISQENHSSAIIFHQGNVHL